jgi:hypothetical protein
MTQLAICSSRSRQMQACTCTCTNITVHAYHLLHLLVDVLLYILVDVLHHVCKHQPVDTTTHLTTSSMQEYTCILKQYFKYLTGDFRLSQMAG